MLLGHTTFAEQAFQDARLDAVHNIEFTETGNVSSYEAAFSIGTEVATGGATVSPDTNVATFSIGDETAFGEAFQNLITLSVNDVDLTLWNETDDSETSSWTEVDDSQTVDWTEVDDSQTASWTKID
jgi:hypothetical protein